MQVLLASDSNCDRAACALCVGVGRLHEPKDMPGLAHFCEHMLFLGTEAFPDEAEYKRFIKRHGGKCNASTGDAQTCYVFDVAPLQLAGALDRFCQFFRTPLFTESATEREINAVDSEHSMRLQDDGRRSYAVPGQRGKSGDFFVARRRASKGQRGHGLAMPAWIDELERGAQEAWRPTPQRGDNESTSEVADEVMD
ncbi:unnamed protein product [Durusdinium trenchii]|uniref:Peptidase M16 N-terminal domain-containing protein n=1 Tax=Durusdinium trenchii TaxID=1381693 RepID=A0ABP0T126_9DINO